MTASPQATILRNDQSLSTESNRSSQPLLEQISSSKETNDENNDVIVDADPIDTVKDFVLVVPRKLTKHAQEILYLRKAIPMSWHLEGRFGSRTFRVDDLHMGIPVLDKVLFFETVDRFPDLREFIGLPNVMLRHQKFVEPPKHRTKEMPCIDARHHPERAPEGFDLDVALEEARKISLHPTRSKPLFTYAELFAGMGGFGVALDALGGRCIFCSEIEKHLREVYHHNFVTIPNRAMAAASDLIDVTIHGDICKVPDSAFPKSLDLLVAGFPCQPFSALGEQPGFDCPKSGNLFLEIVRCLRVSKPKAFLLENVPGLLTMAETYTTIIKALEAAGYDVSTEVVAARGLTATGRKRLFFVGLRRQRDAEQPELTHCSAHNGHREYQFPFIPDLQLKSRDVIDYDELTVEEIDILRLSEEMFQQLLDSGRWRTSSLAWPNKILETMTSHYGNAVGRGESQLVPCRAPLNPRRFSVRECSRIMGFPASYEFMPPYHLQTPMGYCKMIYRMVGNAVCPPLVAALAGSVLDCTDIELPQSPDGTNDWVVRGRLVAIALAKAATRAQPAPVPRGCLTPIEYSYYS
ncbi:C-5 cytosine-specific DNA-methylase [Nitzschia inconspicua]|uniref:DNA (cytosine-5-)-methyltransferase n=1 Tax=Nitzschia inconspicua TaxID=303405 RepID=A0A9K3M1X9_9STRA|nr:C-5 cytosine-specific DNA-methylase [Nitzschia inconspicua]